MLPPYTMVIEYTGEVVRRAVADVREHRYEQDGMDSCYMFKIDDEQIVDSTMRGNVARFINHSCDPNCVARIVSVEGRRRIVIVTRRRVHEGEELTYDYKFASEQSHKRIPCHCKASNCAGRLN